MTWFVTLLVLAVAAAVGIWFLNRYYRKATREVSLIRTGLGGQRVVLDGGCLALPFLHKVAEVNMRTSRLEIERLGPKSMITRDRLRVDAGVEFHVRVAATPEGVATAAQALGTKAFRAGDLAEVLEGKLVDALLGVAARYTMDELQDNRAGYVGEVAAALAETLGRNGLMLESVSLTRLDQTPFHALDENNAFNALGMRRLAEIIAVNKKERAAIEADAEVAVRQSQLAAVKRKLELSAEEEAAMIGQQREIEIARAKSLATTAEEQAESEKRRDAARIARERETRMAEIARDRDLRRQALEAELAAETVKSENLVKLAARRIEEARAEAEAKAARALEATAEEQVRTARETAAAEREKALALIRAAEQAEVDDARVKSEVDSLLAMAEAQARATAEKARADKDRMLAEAEGRAAQIAAENAQTPELMALTLDKARLKALPEVVAQMVKPAEKIDSIRINQFTGFPGGGGGGGTTGGGEGSAVNQMVDGVLNLALQLPAVKALGEEVGVNVGAGLKGLGAGLGPAKPAPTEPAPERD